MFTFHPTPVKLRLALQGKALAAVDGLNAGKRHVHSRHVRYHRISQ